MTKMIDKFNELRNAEAAWYNQIATTRTENGKIPMEADIRRATRVIPKQFGEEPIDPRMNQIMDGEYRTRFINWVAHKPKGRVLDICCGPGWLALELGRRGQNVDAYDLSPEAIAVAKRMLAENPYKDKFGKVTYHVQDVTAIDLGREQYDAVSGWSAFHHLPNLHEFMERVWVALKPGGVIATLDDRPRGRLECQLERAFSLLLPNYTRTYRQKAIASMQRILRITNAPPEIFSPMESTKHSTVQDIADIWYDKFEVIEDIQMNAFSSYPLVMLNLPDKFRYPTAHALVGPRSAFVSNGNM